MKYLEQRVEELELEVNFLKAKFKLQETKTTGFVDKQPNFLEKKNTSYYLTNNYPLSPDRRNTNINNYFFNSSVNLMSEPNLETVFSGSCDDKSYEGGFLSAFDIEDKRFLQYLNSAKIQNTTEEKIEKDFGKIVFKFKILNHEWEMDGYGYIVNNGIDTIIVTTNHGKTIVVDKDYLNLKIKEYKEIIQETERALFLIK